MFSLLSDPFCSVPVRLLSFRQDNDTEIHFHTMSTMQWAAFNLCLATKIDTVTLTLVMTETEMSLTEEMSLIVVITITTITDILETLIEEIEILEAMTIDPLTFKETSPVLVHSMETSKRGWMSTMKLPLNMLKKTKKLAIQGPPLMRFPQKGYSDK